jgi:LmbE family N-acetylglucosaminyl deacetylase
VADHDLLPFPEDWSRALCVVAHPDDLEYGGAAAVARWTSEGRAVEYLLVTSGEAGIDSIPPAEAGPLRRTEQRASAAEVGVSSVTFLDEPDGTIVYSLDLRRRLAREIRRSRPDLLVGINPHGDWGPGPGGGLNQADHRAVGMATVDAARDAGNRWVFPELIEGEELEPWGGCRWVAFAASPHATHAVDVTGHLDRGVASLRAHATYLANLGQDAFDAEAFLTEWAVAAGQRLGVPHAVTFELFDL